jgi:hypothetical protein
MNSHAIRRVEIQSPRRRQELDFFFGKPARFDLLQLQFFPTLPARARRGKIVQTFDDYFARLSMVSDAHT